MFQRVQLLLHCVHLLQQHIHCRALLRIKWTSHDDLEDRASGDGVDGMAEVGVIQQQTLVALIVDVSERHLLRSALAQERLEEAMAEQTQLIQRHVRRIGQHRYSPDMVAQSALECQH